MQPTSPCHPPCLPLNPSCSSPVPTPTLLSPASLTCSTPLDSMVATSNRCMRLSRPHSTMQRVLGLQCRCSRKQQKDISWHSSHLNVACSTALPQSITTLSKQLSILSKQLSKQLSILSKLLTSILSKQQQQLPHPVSVSHNPANHPRPPSTTLFSLKSGVRHRPSAQHVDLLAPSLFPPTPHFQPIILHSTPPQHPVSHLNVAFSTAPPHSM